MLVEAVVVQLGVGLIEKHVADSAIALDPLEVVTLKIMTYRDEYPRNWDEFVSAPIKQLVHDFPVLRRCSVADCTCECWHNPDGLQIKEPIMDVWRRQFLTDQFRPAPALKSVIFSVCLRIPFALLPDLLSRSGKSGSYMEPRTPDGKEVLDTYVVVWAPRMSTSELAHLRQTNPAVIGIARLGERRGVRVLTGQAEQIHSIIRPDATFMPSGPKIQWIAGPFPWGTDRAAVTKALKQFGWQVQTLQPMQPVPGKGSMWLVQSVDTPPETIFSTSHGEVVISKHKSLITQKANVRSTVGSKSTLTLCGTASTAGDAPPPGGEVDPWTTADPWGSYNRLKTPAFATAAADGLQQLENRIQSAVLAKLPVSMDQDDMPDRISALEGQVQQLMTKHMSLEGQFNDFSQQSNQQFAVVQQQIQQQSNQFHGQLETQSQGIQAMFAEQMQQIRGLLAKRPRDDNME